MIPSAAFYVRRSRQVEENTTAVLHRRLRDHSNVLEMPEQLFQSNFRMSKICFQSLLEEVSPFMARNRKSTAIPPTLKLVAFLRFLAVGSYQLAVGNEHMAPMSQSRMSRLIKECLDIFEQHVCPKWIRFNMTEAEESHVKEHFYSEYGLPGVIGCVDGTHVRIKAPEHRHLYYNRKGFYSINAMVICDHNMVIKFVDARSPGSNHDAFIWRMSVVDDLLKSAYNAGKRNTWLLGDAGYQLLPYLMTPYRQPRDNVQILYNSKLCKARNVVERCFGVMKNRFRCILSERGLHYSPEVSTRIINACCALHNICIFHRNDWEPSTEPELPENMETESEEQHTTPAATSVRDELARSVRV